MDGKFMLIFAKSVCQEKILDIRTSFVYYTKSL